MVTGKCLVIYNTTGCPWCKLNVRKYINLRTASGKIKGHDTNFRLKTGCDCLAVHVRKIGIYESSECTISQIPNSTMDKEHLLHCPKLDTDQQVLKNTHQTLLGCLSDNFSTIYHRNNNNINAIY
jgi:hypothetical protein